MRLGPFFQLSPVSALTHLTNSVCRVSGIVRVEWRVICVTNNVVAQPVETVVVVLKSMALREAVTILPERAVKLCLVVVSAAKKKKIIRGLGKTYNTVNSVVSINYIDSLFSVPRKASSARREASRSGPFRIDGDHPVIGIERFKHFIG